jgi:hypothetical protein
MVGVRYVANILAHSDAGAEAASGEQAVEARVSAHFLRARMAAQQYPCDADDNDDASSLCCVCQETTRARRHDNGWLDQMRCPGCGVRVHLHCALRCFMMRGDTACPQRCGNDWCPPQLRRDAVRATARASDPCGHVSVRVDLPLDRPPMDADALLHEAVCAWGGIGAYAGGLGAVVGGAA